MRKILLLIYVFSVCALGEEIDLGNLFSRYPMSATILVENLDGSERYVHNMHRAETRFTVASTFKIPNSLIAIEEDVVSEKQSVFEWDGKERQVNVWNKNQTLESAFQLSCVWCYQRIAREIGAEKYRAYLDAMDYGDLPQQFDTQGFWLDGSLKLSAVEQIRFLKRLYKQTLSFDVQSFRVLKEIMLVEATPTYSIYAKTGWAPQEPSPVGWYVGYIETDSGIWFFATNLAVRERRNLKFREEVTMKVLAHIGAIPAL